MAEIDKYGIFTLLSLVISIGSGLLLYGQGNYNVATSFGGGILIGVGVFIFCCYCKALTDFKE